MFKPIRNQLWALYGVGFGFATHLALTTYINSSFLTLGKGFSPAMVGALFSLGALVAIIELAFAPRWYERIGNKALLSVLVMLHLVALAGVILGPGLVLVGIFFVTYLAASSIMYYTIDLNLEHYSREELTGNTRGSYLTISNTAWVLFPFIGGIILGDNLDTINFIPVYLVGMVALVALLIYVSITISSYRIPPRARTPFLKTLRQFWYIPSLRKIALSHFLLQFFYAIMVIYTPIYLTTQLGLSWDLLGTIFLIMLLPFVLLEMPLGRLADTRLGEKEILLTGFIIMIIATASMSFITTSTWWVWAIVLFLTRTGASAVEVMSESYFYKNITEKEADFISLFRDARPLAYLFGPLIATTLLAPNVINLPLRWLFLVLASILCLGVWNGYGLRDTK